VTPKKLEIPIEKKNPKTYMLRVRIPYDDFLYLAELSLERGITLSAYVRSIISAFRVMMDAGVWKILKPIPEMEKMLLEEIESEEKKETQQFHSRISRNRAF